MRVVFSPASIPSMRYGISSSIGTWTTVWAFLLALAWLLPNHYLPWTAFHSEAWAGFVIGLAAIVLVFLSSAAIAWRGLTVITGGLIVLPFLQYSLGILPFAGQAWISTAYLLGLLVTMLGGARWEMRHPGHLANAIFLAIGMAAIASVGLQLHQWLKLDGLEILSMGISDSRPYGNLGQPNQLASLLLLGLLACAWSFVKENVRAPVAVVMASFLLVGIALTQSRTAWIGLALLLASSWLSRKHWPSARGPWVVTLLCAFFILANLTLPWLGASLQVTSAELREVSLNTELRPSAWRMFIDASLQRPWLGYGWTSASAAHLAVALDHPGLGVTFQHTHNLFIDLLLWCGLPIGLLASAGLIWWFVSCIRAVKNIDDVLLVMFIAVLGNHALLEFPLQYAYFLLPAGLVIGALDERLSIGPKIMMPRWTFSMIVVASAVLYALLVRDYFRIEESFYALRFERARIGTLPPEKPPEVVLLTQLREEIRLARYEPEQGMTLEAINWVRDVANTSPGTSEFYRLAAALALNGQPEEARLALERLCKVVPKKQCDLVGAVWRQRAKEEPRIASVGWPD